MRYFSTFSGIGGFEKAIGKKHKCVGYSEIDTYAVQVYKKHFPRHKNYGDIKTIEASKLPDFDLFVGGFPCQAFSIAGLRRGFADTRGTLFFDIARILREKRPQLLLLENVKGLLSHDSGKTFSTIIATLTELGYDLQWQVLNSKNFGVPQNRERVFIVGHIRGKARPEIFPFRENDQLHSKKNESDRGRTQAKFSSTLKAAGNIKADDTFIIHNVYGGFNEKNVREFHQIAPTIRTPQGGGHIPMVVQRPRGKNKGGLHKIAPTITGKSYQDNNHVDGIRRLTPTECERLQGFPDGWTDVGISDSQRYKTLGNAVTVNVVKAVISKLICEKSPKR